jgi:hypothetical protein
MKNLVVAWIRDLIKISKATLQSPSERAILHLLRSIITKHKVTHGDVWSVA